MALILKAWTQFSTNATLAQSLCDAMLRFDPAKRITAREALGHTWLTGEVKDSPLSANVLDLMRSYNAEQRLRKIFLTVRAAIRFLARKSGRSGVTVSHDSIVGLSALSIGSSSVSHGSESTSVASGSASRKASSGPTGIGPSIYRSTEGSEGSKSRIGQSKGPRAEGITTPSIVSGPLRPAKLASIVTASPVSGESHGSPSPVSKTPNKSPLPNCLINASRHRAIPAGQKDPGTPDKATQQQRKSYQHSSMSSHATFHGTASTPPSSTQPRTSSFSLNEHEPKATSGQRKTVTTAAMTPETTTTVRGVSVQKAKSSAPRRVSTPAANFRIGELK